jgi:hypothetical protein
MGRLVDRKRSGVRAEAVRGVMRRFGSDQERRRRRSKALYDFEMALREEGISDLLYDEGEDLFRFPDGKFAFSREWADEKLLEERGYVE